MPGELHDPGVDIEEVPAGARTITGVATSIAAFVGRARRGPTDRPVVVTSFGDFERVFGGLWTGSRLGHSVRNFFVNGGSTAVIVRLFEPDGDARAVLEVGSVDLAAASEGTWGNHLQAMVDHDAAVPADPGLPANVELFNLWVRDAATGVEEQHRDVTVDEGHPRSLGEVLAAESQLVRLDNDPLVRPAETDWTDSSNLTTTADDGIGLTQATFIGGTAGDDQVGLYLLEQADLFNLLVVPPFTASEADRVRVITAAAAYCERRRAMLLVDAPPTWHDVDDATAGVRDLRASVGTASRNAALYFPWLRQPDPLQGNQLAAFAPSGAVAGVIARTDAERGVWKAPAGLDAGLVGVPDLAVGLTDDGIGQLNPLGVNCLRAVAGAGPVVWGARTLQGADALASEWKYVPVRRTALFIQESLYRGMQWVVFEPNDESLWAQLRLSAGTFMASLFRQGAFQGATSRDAYLVKCDAETTTQADIDRGIVNVLVGFAPLKPAEFVLIRIRQVAGQSAV